MAQTLQEKAQLLQHLHTQRYLTLTERRQAQILDEYAFLRDKIEDHETEENDDGDSSLRDLAQELKNVLETELIPIPKRSQLDSKSASIRDQKVAQMLSAIVAEKDGDKQLRELVDLVSRLLKHEDSGVELFSSLEGELKVLALVDQLDPQPPLLALIAALTSYSGPRRTYLPVLPPAKVLEFVSSDDGKVREYATHILANYSYEMRSAIPLEAGKKMLAIVSKYEEEQIGFQALRCLTNLAMDDRHRRSILESSSSIDVLVGLLKSKHVDYQAQAAWTIANLSATPFDGSQAVELLIERLSSSSDAVVYHSLAAISNFALMETYQTQFKSPKLLEAIINLIESPDPAILEEALRAVSLMLSHGWIKDSSFIESFALASLTLVDSDYEFYSEKIALQATWCLAHLTNSYSETRQLILDHNGLEILAVALEEGLAQAHIPLLWTLSGLSELVSSRQKFRDLEMLRPLVEYLFKDDKDIQIPASRVLSNLSHDAANKRLIGQLYQKLAVQEPMIMARLALDTRPGFTSFGKK